MSESLRITLLRHAHALPASAGQSDSERVLCSPAERTRQTLAKVEEALGFVDTRIEPSIYEATPGELFELIDRHKEAGDLLLVGHNPGFESVAALLSTGQSGDYRGMPPAGIAELELSPDTALEPGAARLVAFWSP